MKFQNPHFRAGLALTAVLALCSIVLAEFPGLAQLGPLTIAILLGAIWRLCLHTPQEHHTGIAFSAKSLLRLAIILLGIRLNFALILQSGLKILLLDIVVVSCGVGAIYLLGRFCKLEGRLPLLLAVGNSICGASAIAATAPTLKAKDEEIALAIPLCTLLGTVGVLLYTLLQQNLHLSPHLYGIFSGSTLQEVAQVIAAAGAVDNSLVIGTITKLVRVILLVPVVFLLGKLIMRRHGHANTRMEKPWFILWFLAVGIIHSALSAAGPETATWLKNTDPQILTVANFLMAMAMAGLGLQVHWQVIRQNGLKALGVCCAGWLVVISVAATMMWCLKI